MYVTRFVKRDLIKNISDGMHLVIHMLNCEYNFLPCMLQNFEDESLTQEL